MPTLNLNEATKLYYGNTEAQKLYKGGELLYPSPFSLLNLSPALWLDADDLSTLTLVSGAVSEWRDKSGNNRHATQGTAGNRPLLVANGLNGTDVVRFDGVDDFLICNGFSPLNSSNSIGTIFVLSKTNTPLVNGGLLSLRPNALLTGWSFRVNNNAKYFYYHTGFENANFGLVDTTYILSCLEKNSLQITTYSNMLPQGSFTFSGYPSATQSLIIGAESGGTASFLNGDISQIIIFPLVLTQAEREKVEGYLAHKTGLQANLPVNHPYKNSAP